MTLARKGTRRIVVDGVEFRWKVRHKPTYDQGIGSDPLTFVAELAEYSGALLVVSLPYPHPGNWLELPSVPVLPRTVATAIRLAMERGWQPSRPGPAFELSLDKTLTSAA
ncbi:hypothetical protein [Thermomonospora amylolytica]|uniref:hypothetical protein n=1 Tax=Thermomonospora amylolytica TaxID=1411117 RepID=UPI000E6BFC73|nr:hypothetical protein [Thermomonospora amylolytica]